MNTPLQQSKALSRGGRRLALSLALATLLGAAGIAPAMADRDDRGGEHRRMDRHSQHRGHAYGHEYRQPYSYRYAQPIYVPPPVYYEPRQSPGISLFLPLDTRR